MSFRVDFWDGKVDKKSVLDPQVDLNSKSQKKSISTCNDSICTHLMFLSARGSSIEQKSKTIFDNLESAIF